MPNYVYECKKCKGQVEIIRKISESDSKPTTEELAKLDADCKHEELVKLMFGFTLNHGYGYGSKGNWK